MGDSELRSIAVLQQGNRLLAEAKTFEDIRQVRDLAIAAQAYAKAHELGSDAQRMAGELAVRAERLLGEIITKQKQSVGFAKGGEHFKSTTGTKRVPVERLPTLRDAGISKKLSAGAQQLAAMPEDRFEEALTKMQLPTPGRARRVARDYAAATRPAPIPPPQPPNCDIRHGDFREVLADVPDASVDVVLTDPPYPKEFLSLWSDLGRFAKRVLKKDGMLVAMSGQLHLPAVYAALAEHLPYRWTIAYLATGHATVVHARRIHCMWKPVVVYGAMTRRLYDVARSDRAEKQDHEWGQSENGFSDLLRLVADPGQIICDPFLGAGTTAVCALRYGCSFVGAELEERHFVTARRRAAA